MPNLATVLKTEIRRLARRENRVDAAVTKRVTTQHRRDIAELKRRLQDFGRRLAFLENQEKKRPIKTSLNADGVDKRRFSPKWLKGHRRKLGLSAADYAKLVGVASLTIYNWEGGKSKPRQQQMAAIAAVRKLGKREALRRLDLVNK